MQHRHVLLTVILAILVCFVGDSSGNDVKHKKVIIKVPKKINHVHHHHVKKMHVWKHKPKPIHSIHIVEEDEHEAGESKWKEKSLIKKHKKFNGWKEHKKPAHQGWEEEGEDYEEDFHDEDPHKKSGSHFEPVVWKGNKGSRGNSGKKWREPSSIGGRSKGKPRGNSYKGDRAKRQKSPVHYDDRWQEESRYNRRPKGKKPKTTNTREKGSYDRKPRHKPKPSYRPIEKGFVDYGEYDDLFRDLPVWPERKEHISWHLRGEEGDRAKPAGVSEEPYLYQNEYGTEHNGEIDLSKAPDIPVVPAPNLVPKYKPAIPEEPEYRKPEYRKPEKPKQVEYRKPENPKQVEYRKPENPKQVEYRKPENFKQVEYRKPENPKQVEYRKQEKVKVSDYRKPKNPINNSVVDSFHSDHSEGTIAGYSSHVGHNSEGDSASFQSVRFGEKKIH